MSLRMLFPPLPPNHGQAGALPVVVDEHDVAASPGQKGGGDRGTEAARAVDPHLAVGDAGDVSGQVVERNVHGPVEVSRPPLVMASRIQDDHVRVRLPGLCEIGEVRDLECPVIQAVAEGLHAPGGAEAGQLSLRMATSSAVSPTSVIGVPQGTTQPK